MITFNIYIFCCFSILFTAHVVASQDANITISLGKTITYKNKELYGDFVYLNRSTTLQVNFDNVNQNISFIIFQVHSYLYNVTLYKNIIVKGNVISGTNVGLHSEVDKLDTFFVVNSYEYVDLKLFLTVHGYLENDPIPGGCSFVSKMPTPYLALTYNKDYIFIDAAAAKIDVNCLSVNKIYLEFWMLYLPHQDFGADAYFDAIMRMSSLANIKRYGSVVYPTAWIARRMVSAYPGTGAVYVAIAYYVTSENNLEHYGIYVPILSYACSPLLEGDCKLLDDTFSELLCASLLFLGIFICYYGRHFFIMQTLLIGFLSGAVVTYILLLLFFDMDTSAMVAASALSGLCVGAVRVTYWWLYGMPVFAIILTASDVGFLTASLLYYIAPNIFLIRILQNDNYFWCIFIFTMLLITVLLLSLHTYSNLLCSSIIGAYTAIYSIDFYFGSNLKYILHNTVRRATVPLFDKALIMPMFQWNDAVLTFVWIFLTVSGFAFQYYQNRGEPPYPTPPGSSRAAPEEPSPIIPRRPPNIVTEGSGTINERTPLLA